MKEDTYQVNANFLYVYKLEKAARRQIGDSQSGSMYLSNKGLTSRHLSLADRDTPLLGPGGRLPSSSPISSSAAGSGVYGSAESVPGLTISSNEDGDRLYRNTELWGRIK